MADYDHIVVGAGSAGCVVAARLSDAGRRVLLIEAGPPDRSFNIHMPAGAATFHDGRSPHNWSGMTEPQEALDGRPQYWPTGRGWGGTSSINGMAYVRGHRADYDGWAALGLRDWSYAHLLPYFRRAEQYEHGASLYHGGSGPLRVSDVPNWLPLSRAFVAAGAAAGYPSTDDFNGATQEGFGRLQMTLHRGQRWSSATAYLRPALKTGRLTVASNALASRVLIEGDRAVGVAWTERGQARTARGGEIVLCAGVTRTPQLLMLSGIGEASALRRLGLDVVADRPEVGRNLQDHVCVQLKWTCTRPVSLYSQTKWHHRLRTGLAYLLFRKGLAQSMGVETNAFVRSRPDIDQPDLQLAFVNMLMEGIGLSDLRMRRHGFSVSAWHLRPDARGIISLASTDPSDHPLVQPRYLSGLAEQRALRAAVGIVRRVIAQSPFDIYRGYELAPGPSVETDEAIDAWLRANAFGLFHPVGTARMGTDPDAVVDSELRVRGIRSLRVADASVMPRIVSGNTNAAVVMIGEKASDLLLGRPPPEPIETITDKPIPTVSTHAAKQH